MATSNFSSPVRRHANIERRNHVNPTRVRNHVVHSGPTETVNSQDCSDSYDDYFSEIQDIDEHGGAEPVADDDHAKVPHQEGEAEASWLTQAGYGELVAKFEEGHEIDEQLIVEGTSSLTKKQAAAVKKRVNTLNATLRKKKNKHNKKTDIRDVFSLPSEDTTAAQTETTPVTMRRPKATPTTTEPQPVSRRSSHRSSHIIKHKRGYDMSGDSDLPHMRATAPGIETLSINIREHSGSPRSRRRQADSLMVTDAEYSSVNYRLKDNNFTPQKFTEKVIPKDSLPTYEMVTDSLGLTRIDSLSELDVAKLRTLALLESTSLFDTYNLSYTSYKNKKRFKESGVFGVPLHILLENDQKTHPHTRVPRFLHELISYLSIHGVCEEGILRVPGAVNRIKSLKQELEHKFYAGKFRWDDVRPNDAAGLLKLFLRELPIPLLTSQYLDAFIQLQSIKDIKDQLQALTHFIILLPSVHRDTLLLLLQFLKAVVDVEENKMTMNNVAMIMAPNLFLVQQPRGAKTRDASSLPAQELSLAAGTSGLVKKMIHYQSILWVVPSFMVAQIRHQYEADHLKRSGKHNLFKLLGKKDKSGPYKKPPIQNEADYNACVIQVLAPQLNKFSTAVKLDVTTTAEDVLAKFPHYLQRQQQHTNGQAHGINGSPSKLRKVYLYEEGGNIGKRKLESNTKMLELYRQNPNAQWVIQPDHGAFQLL